MPKSLPLLDLSGELCCAPVVARALTEDEALEVALRLKALADPVRVRTLSLLLAAGADGLRNVDLAALLDLSDATVSHHLGQLHRAGLLTRRPSGREVHYVVERSPLAAIARVIDPNCC
ncbi:MAG: metalloregulator ArsR/SmtB family transcription factor [Acidimicrobiales bacterium]